VRLTRAGTSLAVATVPAVVLAWLFGLPELSVLAAAAAVAVALAAAWVRVRAPRLQIERTARPPRLAVGEHCEIRLTACNGSTRPTAVTTLADEVGRFGTARLVLAPLAPRARCVATYSLPTPQRGVQHVGPLSCSVEDPFGLARRSVRDPSIITVMVLPRTWVLDGLPAAPGDEPEHGTHVLSSASTVDEEFAALRDYVPGDDIRRIHWRSTARRGAPVVRQFDVPWQRRTTVLVDQRAGVDDAAFERAVSAAASVLDLVARRDELVRLVTTAGADSGYVPAGEHLDDLMDSLAVLSTDAPRRDRPDPLLGTLSELSRTNTSRVVTCTAAMDTGEATTMPRVTAGIARHVVVTTGSDAPAVDTGRTVQVRFDGRAGLDVVWRDATRDRTPAAQR
jgi:uncharacterized protein (DUF58 family)